MLDSGASKTFVNSRQGLQLTGHSNKVVVTAGSTKLKATKHQAPADQCTLQGCQGGNSCPWNESTSSDSVSTLANK